MEGYMRTITFTPTGNRAINLRPAHVKVSDYPFTEASREKRSNAAEPIKNPEDIRRITEYLVEHQRWRDNLLFIMGINVGLRCGDLTQLRVGHIVTEDGRAYRDKIVFREHKTGKDRIFYLNEAVCNAADLYFAHKGTVSLNDYLFKTDGNRGKNMDLPLTVRSVERILKEVINEDLHLQVRASTHCLRKTFAYHMILGSPDRDRAIEFLQKVFGHSNALITLRYAGITEDEMRQAYRGLNLGLGTKVSLSVAS